MTKNEALIALLQTTRSDRQPVDNHDNLAMVENEPLQRHDVEIVPLSLEHDSACPSPLASTHNGQKNQQQTLDSSLPSTRSRHERGDGRRVDVPTLFIAPPSIVVDVKSTMEHFFGIQIYFYTGRHILNGQRKEVNFILSSDNPYP